MKRSGIFIACILLFAAAVTGQTLKVLTPNGGESWPAGQVRVITWQAQGIAGTVRIILRRAGEKVGDIAGDIPVAQGSFSWTVGALDGGGTAAPASGYVVRVRTTDNLYGDDSNAGFRIYRQIAAQEQQRPDVQAGQGQPRPDVQVGLGQARPDLRPGQNQAVDPSGLSAMPDMAIIDFRYIPARHIIECKLKNIGLADYNGIINTRLEVADGGCWDQARRLHLTNFKSGYVFNYDFIPCDFFPSRCGHPFRLVIEPEGADERSANNVLDAIFYRYPGYHFFPVPPVRLEFSHGSKQLACDHFVYDAANTITRNDILNDFNPGTGMAQIRFVVGAQNCGNAGSSGTMMIRLSRLRGSAEETLAQEHYPFRHLAPGQEGRFEITLDVPVYPGIYYVYIVGGPGEGGIGNECKATFTFASEFFD
jgi:hypothetical protein